MQPDSLSLTRNPRFITLFWASLSFDVALAIRIALWLTYSPVTYSDTPSYRRLATAVLRGFERYDGTRTPGYPAFLALVGSDENVWLAQMGMGLLISLILFYLGWRLSGKAWFGGLLSLSHSANLGQLFFEANLLTETLSTFFLVLVAVSIYWFMQYKTHSPLGLAFSIGIWTTLALLTRPLFIYLPLLVILVLLLPKLPQPLSNTFNRPNLIRLAAFALPALLLLGGWALFIHQRFGDWGLTTMTGYHMVQHTGGYFEFVPDEYAELRDTYIRFRDAHIAEYGTQTNTIWEAIPEMSRASGLNFYDLSRTLSKISLNLILEHPGLYLQNVLQGWWMFWRAPVYWSPQALQFPALTSLIEVLINIERVALWIVNLAFIAGSLLWFGLGWLPADLRSSLSLNLQRLSWTFIPSGDTALPEQTNNRFMVFIAGNIWLASIVQTLVDHGDNPRFLVPLQSFVVLWVAWFIWSIIKSTFHPISTDNNTLSTYRSGEY